MILQNTPTSNISKETLFKSLVKFKNKYPNRVYLSNEVSPEEIPIIRKYCGYDTEIVYFEHIHPICPDCGTSMSENGTVKRKPNKMKNIRSQQYICPIADINMKPN